MPECTDYASNMHMHIHIMHIWAYPSMSAWMCILVWAIPGRIWMNTGYCMTVLCQICIRMIIWKKPNSGYDYMHIRVLSGFISIIFNISGQHWFLPTPVGTWPTLVKDLGHGLYQHQDGYHMKKKEIMELSLQVCMLCWLCSLGIFLGTRSSGRSFRILQRWWVFFFLIICLMTQLQSF
jgi:hypothetical protein